MNPFNICTTMEENDFDIESTEEIEEASFLLIDDNPDDRKLAIRELEKVFHSVEVEEIIDEDEFNEALKNDDFDMVITDYEVRWTSGLDVLHEVKKRWPDKPVIMFTGTGNEEVAVRAMKSGLDDYIVKTTEHFKRLSASALSILEQYKEREKAQEALEEMENKYKTIVENTGTALIMINGDKNIIMANQEAKKMTGYEQEEVIGRKWTDLVVEEDLSRMEVYHRLRRKDPESAPHRYGFQMVNKFGDVKDVFMTIDMIPGTGKSIASIIDVTKSKEMLRALRESQELFRICFDDVPVGISIMEKDGTFLHVNDELQTVFGYSEDEFTQMKMEDLLHEEDKEDVMNELEELISGERREFEAEKRCLTKSGEVITATSKFTTVQANEGPDYIVCTIRVV